MPDRIPRFYRPESYRPEDSVTYRMRRITVALAAQVEQALEPCGLTYAQWIPIYKLRYTSVTTAAELARECFLDAGSMTRMLDRLEAKGFVRRVRSQEDRRVVKLDLTAQGRETAEKIPAVLCQVQNACLRGFDRAELDTLAGLLDRMLGNARQLQPKGDGGGAQ